MGRYDLKAFFDKESAAIAGTIKALLMVAVLFGLRLGEPQLAAVALGLEAVLTLFVRNSSTSVAAPSLPPGTDVTITTPSGQPNLSITLPDTAGDSAEATNA